ncbi:MAG: hypothetical protein ACO1NY_01200 [Pseudorhodoplanes sp.]
MSDDAVLKVMGVMTKVWDYQPTTEAADAWRRHATWLASSIAAGKSRAEMDAYMSRAQMLMRMRGSMAFRKIVDGSIEVMATGSSEPASDRVAKLNPTGR